MRPQTKLAILTASGEPQTLKADPLSRPANELLPVRQLDRVVGRHVLIIIGQREKAARIVHLGFMRGPDAP